MALRLPFGLARSLPTSSICPVRLSAGGQRIPAPLPRPVRPPHQSSARPSRLGIQMHRYFLSFFFKSPAEREMKYRREETMIKENIGYFIITFFCSSPVDARRHLCHSGQLAREPNTPCCLNLSLNLPDFIVFRSFCPFPGWQQCAIRIEDLSRAPPLWQVVKGTVGC